MDRLNRCLRGLLFVLAMAAGLAANATLIPVGTSPANDLIVNFQFTLPGAPYSSLSSATVLITGASGGNVLAFDAFAGLNGQGLLEFGTATLAAGSSTLMIGGISFPQFLDGTF